jgi:hypothetical protein
MLRFNLKPFLERHHISAYQLARATRGKLSEATVYSLSRAPQRRIDLESVKTVIGALEQLTGEKLTLLEFLDELPEQEPVVNPKLAQILKSAKPAGAGHLSRTAIRASPGELEEDEHFWEDHRTQQAEIQHRMEERRDALWEERP